MGTAAPAVQWSEVDRVFDGSSSRARSAGQPGAAVPTLLVAAARRSASINCAPYISPEASPAEIRIRKWTL